MANLINLETVDGQNMLQGVKKSMTYFQPNLFRIFEKQKGNKNCGIQSSSLLLNAAYIGQISNDTDMSELISNLPFKEDKMFSFQETLNVADREHIEQSGGLTLEEVYKILKSHGHFAEIFYASDSSVCQFRSKVKECLSHENSTRGIIVNYHMETLGQSMPIGHHSPLCGYTEAKDMALIMDTWKDTHECWAKLEDIFKAMNTFDSASEKTRGFIAFNYTPPETLNC